MTLERLANMTFPEIPDKAFNTVIPHSFLGNIAISVMYWLLKPYWINLFDDWLKTPASSAGGFSSAHQCVEAAMVARGLVQKPLKTALQQAENGCNFTKIKDVSCKSNE